MVSESSLSGKESSASLRVRMKSSSASATEGAMVVESFVVVDIWCDLWFCAQVRDRAVQKKFGTGAGPLEREILPNWPDRVQAVWGYAT